MSIRLVSILIGALLVASPPSSAETSNARLRRASTTIIDLGRCG